MDDAHWIAKLKGMVMRLVNLESRHKRYTTQEIEDFIHEAKKLIQDYDVAHD